MRLHRSFSPTRAIAILGSAVIAAAAFTGPATAAAGVGTSASSTKVLTAQLGDNAGVLDLLLLGDEARSTIDPAVASPEAHARLTLLSAKSALVPALNSLNLPTPPAEAKSSGPTSYAIPAQSFPSSVTAAPGPVSVTVPTGSVLSGSVRPGELSAFVNNGIASADINAGVDGVSAVGGLISIQSLKSALGAMSATDSSAAGRSVKVDNITVLDLGSLLQGLGISLPDLTVAQLVALIDALAASNSLPLPSGSATLDAAVKALQQAIDDLQAAIAGAPGTTQVITDAIDSTTGSLLDLIGVTSPLPSTTQTVSDAVTTVNGLIDQLQAQLDALLGQGLKVLDNLALLRLEGVEVSVTTKAAHTVETSTASVTGKIGKVFVGNLELPGLDLGAAAASISASLESINAKLGSVLATVNPGLANLVKVSVLDQATSVTTDGGYVRSRAGITGASATITPPAELAAIVQAVVAQVNDLGATLGSQSVQGLNLSSQMATLSSTLNVGSGVLTAPSTVRVAQVLSASDFRGAASTTTGAPGGGGPELPRTGPTDVFLFGGLAAMVALATRRWLSLPAMKAVRIKQ